MSILLLFSVALIHADEPTFKSHLPFKEGIIHYTITGTQAGSQTTYIRHNGLEQVIYKKTRSSIMHEASYSDEIIMINPKWTYKINLKTHKAIKELSLSTLFLEEFNALSSSEKADILNQKEYYISGLATIKFSLDGITYYMSKEGLVVLESKAKILGYKSLMKVKNIERCSVDERHFILPEGLDIVEKRSLASRASKMIEALLRL